MPVVLNEVKQAEKIIRDGEVGTKPSSTLFLLGKYYRIKLNMDKAQTIFMLNDFMDKNYKNYNPVQWEEIIENIAKKASKYPIREIECIGITQNELDIIKKLDNIKYEKLVFTMLCHTKLYNMVSENNNGWVNTDIPEIFRLARVVVKHRNDKFLYLNDIENNKLLGDTGLISFSNKNDNLNMKINFIDNDNESILFISDFRELGYEYMNFYGMAKFKKCIRCGKIIKKTTNNQLYCKDCAVMVNTEKQRIRDSAKNLDSEKS